MIQQQVFILNNLRMALDALCIIASGYAAHYTIHLGHDRTWAMDSNVFVGSVMLVMFLNNYVMGRLGLYNEVRPLSFFALLWKVVKAVLADFVILSTGIFLTRQFNYPQEFLLVFAGYVVVSIGIIRFFERIYLNNASRNLFHLREILVVGDMERGKIVSDLLQSQLSWGHEVVGRLSPDLTEEPSGNTLGSIEDLPSILTKRAIDEVVFAITGDRSIDVMKYVAICRKMGIPARILPAMWQPGVQALSVERCQGIPFLTVPVDSFNATGILYKRILDIVGGLIGCALFVCLYPFVAMAIKLDSPGPVLFRQKRIGQNGRVFKLYKFRTMVGNAEDLKKDLMNQNEMDGFMFKMKDDPRTTKVGRLLRKTSLDEFPQFINVLKGEMSLVGTRPPTIDEVEKYKDRHRRRISAKPGITGLWQISGRNKIQDFEEVVELDCQYLDNWRFTTDIKILFKTLLVVLQRKGAL